MKIQNRIGVLFAICLLVIGLLCSCTPSAERNATSDGIPTDVSDPSGTVKDLISITAEVTKADGTKKEFIIRTDAENLRGALEQEHLIEGEESAYGLYVKTVDGERADFDIDHAYWAFYRNGELLMTGVDSTPISDGEHYEIVYTK